MGGLIPNFAKATRGKAQPSHKASTFAQAMVDKTAGEAGGRTTTSSIGEQLQKQVLTESTEAWIMMYYLSN